MITRQQRGMYMAMTLGIVLIGGQSAVCPVILIGHGQILVSHWRTSISSGIGQPSRETQESREAERLFSRQVRFKLEKVRM